MPPEGGQRSAADEKVSRLPKELILNLAELENGQGSFLTKMTQRVPGAGEGLSGEVTPELRSE